jgi:hypothetical protein
LGKGVSSISCRSISCGRDEISPAFTLRDSDIRGRDDFLVAGLLQQSGDTISDAYDCIMVVFQTVVHFKQA